MGKSFLCTLNFSPFKQSWLLILAEKRTRFKICTYSSSLLLGKKKKKKSDPVNLLKLFKHGRSAINQRGSVVKQVQSEKLFSWHYNVTILTSQDEVFLKKCTSITQQRSDQFDIDYRKLNSQWRQAQCTEKLFLCGSRYFIFSFYCFWYEEINSVEQN